MITTTIAANHLNLVLLLLLPLIGIFFILLGDMFAYANAKFMKYLGSDWAKKITLISLVLTFLVSNHIWYEFKDYKILNSELLITILGEYTIIFTVDGINLFFVLLVTYVSPLCVVWDWPKQRSLKYNLFYLFMIFGLLATFTCLDFLFFFVFFESLLLPMFLVIGIYGGRFRRIKAGYYLAFYTLTGSLFLLLGILLIKSEVGTTNYLVIERILPTLPLKKQLAIWVCLFMGFAVKVPLFPLHLWLPEAHVEAPTVGSVILAAFLLKIGGYGLIRWVFVMLPGATYYMTPLVNILALMGVVYGALTAMRQVDLKRIIAYSSVSHMNLGILGVLSCTTQGMEGFIFFMVAHGLVSTALFFLVDSLYVRLHTKLIYYFGGLVNIMPLFTVFFTFFNIANFSYPSTANFFAEILILLGIQKHSTFMFVIVGLGIIFGTLFSILLANRVCFGTVQQTNRNKAGGSLDLTRRELLVLTLLFFFTMYIGIYPEIICNDLHRTVKMVILQMVW